MTLPDVGKPSRYFVEASFTVFMVNSADVPPITMAKWYGGHAAVPRVCSASHMTQNIQWKHDNLFFHANNQLAICLPVKIECKLLELPIKAYRSAKLAVIIAYTFETYNVYHKMQGVTEGMYSN